MAASVTIVAAGVLAAAAVVLLSGPGESAGRLSALRPRAARRDVTPVLETLLVPALLLLGVLLDGVVAGALLAGAAALARRIRRQSAEQRRRRQQLARNERAAAALAAELRAGQTVIGALDAVAAATPGSLGAALRAVVEHSRLGADPAEAAEQRLAGVDGLDRLAACLRVADVTGAGMADVADALAGDLRGRRRTDGEVATALAASRATTHVLAVLPAVGVLLGASIGARPLHFLLHTPAGVAVLAVGLALDAVGLAWTAALARRAVAP
jgi:tight adherence protein B